MLKKTFIYSSITLTSIGLNLHAMDFEDIDIHGSVSQTYFHTTTNEFLIENSQDGSFEFSEILLNASSDITDQLRIGAQLISRDFGEQGNFETELDWGYGDYQFDEKFGVRLGKIRTPLGLSNEYRDVDGSRNSVLLDQGIYPEETRSFLLAYSGIGTYGTFSKDKIGDLEYNFYIGKMNIPENTRFIDQVWQGVGSEEKEMETKVIGGGQFIYTPSYIENLRLSYSYMVYRGSMDLSMTIPTVGTSVNFKDAFNFNIRLGTVGAEYLWDRFTFTSEYCLIQNEANYSPAYRTVGNAIVLVPAAGFVPALTFTDLVLDTSTAGASSDSTAWYFQVDHQCNDNLNAFIRYGELKRRLNGGDVAGHRNNLTLGVRYDINPNMWVKTEYHHMRGKMGIRTEIPNSSALDNEDWGAFAARVTFAF